MNLVTLKDPPEMVIGESLHYCYSHPLPHHKQEGDHYVVVALVVMQLRVSPQNIQDDVNQLLLQPLSLSHPHPWRTKAHSKGLQSASSFLVPCFIHARVKRET